MERRHTGRWQRFLDSLDTGGGHIFVLFILVLVGYRMYQADATAGGQIITLSFGALLAGLKPPEKKETGPGTTVTSISPTPLVPPTAPSDTKPEEVKEQTS